MGARILATFLCFSCTAETIYILQVSVLLLCGSHNDDVVDEDHLQDPVSQVRAYACACVHACIHTYT